MWEGITEKEYFEKVKDLKPIESFSDPEGTFIGGNGKPAMDTIWGIADKKILKCEMQKESRHSIKWQINYFKYLE